MRRRVEAEMAEEMRLHLELMVEHTRAAGMNPHAARYAALRQFGGVDQLKERERDERSWVWLEQLGKDFLLAARTLRKNRGFSVVAIVTLAIGIGATATFFSVINGMLRDPLPYPEPDGLVHLTERNTTGTSTMPVSYPNFLDWQRQQDVFSGLAAFHGANGKLKTAAGTELVAVQHVSADFFNVLGVHPALGRSLQQCLGYVSEVPHFGCGTIERRSKLRRNAGDDLIGPRERRRITDDAGAVGHRCLESGALCRGARVAVRRGGDLPGRSSRVISSAPAVCDRPDGDRPRPVMARPRSGHLSVQAGERARGLRPITT